MEKQEQEELNILTGKGYEFETILFGKKRKWNTGKINLMKMFRMANVFIKMKVDEEALSNPDLSIQIPSQYESVRNNAKLCCEAVYIAVETELPEWTKKYKKVTKHFVKPFLINHFMNSFNSKELLDFTLALLKNSDYQNFTTSTVLMNGNRPTKAIPIEKTV